MGDQPPADQGHDALCAPGGPCLGSSLRELALYCDAMYFGVESETF